jgi:hypothetical protein
LFENKPAEAQPDEGSGRPMSRADRLRAAKNDSPSLNNANTQNQPMSRAEKLKAARNAPSPISH